MIKFIALGGFLGAGKTTTMITAAEQLRSAGRSVVVIANDQGLNLVDTAMLRRRIPGVGEVTTGCFCCRFDDLVSVTRRLVEKEHADTVIAESVGSCTDLTATVIRPLEQLYGSEFELAPLTTVVDPVRYMRFEAGWARNEPDTDLAYLYRNQLRDGDIIAVNKIDLLEPTEVARVTNAIRARFPLAEVVTMTAARRDLGGLCRAWENGYSDRGRDLDIDYGRYGVAEARLAWLNRTFRISAVDGTFDPATWARTALDIIAAACREKGYVVGHVKIMMAGADGQFTEASLIDERRAAAIDEHDSTPAAEGEVTLNARVQCEPAEMDGIADIAVSAADIRARTRSVAEDTISFKPRQPVPTHRYRPPQPIH